MLKNGHKFRPIVLLCGLSLTLMPGASLWAAEGMTGTETHHQPANLHTSAESFSAITGSLPGGIHPYYLSQLAALYHARHLQPMWQDQQAVERFQQQLAEVALSGVQPQFGQWISWLSRSDITGMQRDLILSDAMLGYLQFVAEAPIKGESWLYGNTPYALAMPPSGQISLWQSAVNSHRDAAFVNGLAPQHPQYLPMQDALKKLLADHEVWPHMNGRGSVRPGDSSPEIPVLRDILIRSGMLSENAIPSGSTPAPATHPVVISPASASTSSLQSAPAVQQSSLVTDSTSGTAPLADQGTVPVTPSATPVDPQTVYSPELVDAVKRFQQWQGLAPDGVIGPRTREWLNVTPRMRAGLLALNMQRLRLLPDDMHNGIMVNIPNFSMSFYEDGKTILRSRVIVGRPDRKTPLMRSALNNVVLNPPWNVPTSLVREDIVPKAKSDPSYLEKHGFTLFSGWSADSVVVNPETINWTMVNPATFPYRIRQSPGPQNALGRYKFNMPSSDAIYLHDTPNHMLFQRDIRALSSGCVRINKASELAGLLLQNVGWDGSRISGALQQGDTRFVSIRHRIPVNLYYLTAWVADDGKPQFRTDIYNYDNLARNGQSSVGNAGKFIL
ncbi:L,D-transpeptidase [Tatumella morbirosei]|nr:L,D-transpeptidase [Tatumella morbirosei]